MIYPTIGFSHKINEHLLGAVGETSIFYLSVKHQWFISGDMWIIIRESLAWDIVTIRTLNWVNAWVALIIIAKQLIWSGVEYIRIWTKHLKYVD